MKQELNACLISSSQDFVPVFWFLQTQQRTMNSVKCDKGTDGEHKYGGECAKPSDHYLVDMKRLGREIADSIGCMVLTEKIHYWVAKKPSAVITKQKHLFVR